MKLTIALVAILSIQAGAHALSQDRITLSQKNASLESVLQEISKQTGYDYAFQDQWKQLARSIDINVSNSTLKEVLDICFKNQPFTYEIIQKIIVVREKATVGHPAAPKSPGEAGGTVTDENGDPLYGATIKLKGGKIIGISDAHGNFSISNISDGTTVEISYTGYTAVEILVGSNLKLNVTLKRSNSKLDEVQIIAYGTSTKRLNTGNVFSIKATDIEKQPINNPLLAMQGRVPGIQIIQNTGLPGSGITVKIRGQNSIQNGNDPFYVIDGIPYVSQLMPNLNLNLGNSGIGQNVTANNGNPLTYINPADIESIDILKDADATAIYGSRAANGAVLITTKKGQIGKTKVEATLQSGFGKVAKRLPLLNTKQYLQIRHEAFFNDGLLPGKLDYDINGTWDTTSNTDWQKVLIGRAAKYSDAELSISGGSNNTTFLIGSGYHKETTVYPGNFSDQKGSVHFNFTNNSTNKRFKIRFGGTYLVDHSNLPRTELTNTAVNLAPDAPTLFNPDGSLNWARPNLLGPASWSNPIASLNWRIKSQTENLIANSQVTYMLFDDFRFVTNLGYTSLHTYEVQLTPSTYYDPYTFNLRQNSLRQSSFVNNTISSWIVEPQFKYSKSIQKGKLDAILGTTIQHTQRIGELDNTSGYSSDLLLEDKRSAATSSIGYTENSLYKYNALFGRINLNYQDEYLLDFSARRDGSSRFGPQNQFHNFWAIGSAWIFSKESFVKNNFPVLSLGKLRASYGSTGNDQIAEYQFLDLYNSTNYDIPYQGTNGLVINNLFNPYLQWEETKKFEVAIELGLLKDKILFSTSYFQNRSSNQLLVYSLPTITGFSNITKNLPATVQNSGFEFILNTTNISGKNLLWSSSINFSLIRNKLISFPGIMSSTYSSTYQIGQPITINRTYIINGVDPQSGLYSFSNFMGHSVSEPDPSTDETGIVKMDPTFYGGLQNLFQYKGIQLDFLFQFTKQTGRNYLYGFLPGYRNKNQPVTALNRWQTTGDNALLQRYTSNTGSSVNGINIYSLYNDAALSTLAYGDDSYIRLKNLSLSWIFPAKWIKNLRLQYFRIYLQGQNLLTFTKYKGLDPESQSSTTLPPLRVLTAGIKVGL